MFCWKGNMRNTQSAVFVSVFLASLFVLFFPHSLFAQDAMTLTLTPPLFQLSINPGDTWNSTLKIANVNNYTITLYASVVNFESQGERGGGRFTPILNQDPTSFETSLANWISIANEPIVLLSGETAEIPFSVVVPQNADPGGHYAAILVGTEPDIANVGGSGVAVSSLVTSLLFARITGKIIESGDIREFTTDDFFYQKPEVDFTLRFENKGNVHLLPQGEIAIFNMWGKKRGEIPINQKTEFGNVLSESIRKYAFSWVGEENPFEIGRYKAIATLSFGKEARQNVTTATTFWIVPVIPVLSVVGSIAFITLVFVWLVRRYIRKALSYETKRIMGDTRMQQDRPINRRKALTQPLVDSVMDLRNISLESHPSRITPHQYTKRYRLFFIFIILIFLSILGGSYYFQAVLTPERQYEVRVENEPENMLLPK